MAKRKRLHQDAKFNEWVFKILVNLPVHKKLLLNDYEQKSIRNREEIRRFANNESYEKIDLLLTKIGIQCSRVYYDPANFDSAIAKNTYRQQDKPFENIELMLKQNIFVTTSKEIAISLSLMGINCHSIAFQLNECLRVSGETITGMRKISSNENINSAIEKNNSGFNEVSKLIYHSLFVQEGLIANSPLQRIEIAILLMLSIHRGKNVSLTFLRRNLAAHYKQTVIDRAAVKLSKTGRIDRFSRDKKPPVYIISQLGILEIGVHIQQICSRELS